MNYPSFTPKSVCFVFWAYSDKEGSIESAPNFVQRWKSENVSLQRRLQDLVQEWGPSTALYLWSIRNGISVLWRTVDMWLLGGVLFVIRRAVDMWLLRMLYLSSVMLWLCDHSGMLCLSSGVLWMCDYSGMLYLSSALHQLSSDMSTICKYPSFFLPFSCFSFFSSFLFQLLPSSAVECILVPPKSKL